MFLYRNAQFFLLQIILFDFRDILFYLQEKALKNPTAHKQLTKGGHTMTRNPFQTAPVIFLGIMMLFTVPCFGAAQIPQALQTLQADDGSVWEQVSAPGFGSQNNIAIISLCPFQDRLYALTRNDMSGFEIWRTDGSSWQQVAVPGFTDSVLHDKMNAGYGAMKEHNGYLYVAVGSGYEGAFLYRSVGFEMWRTDGLDWEPVVSNGRDADEAGTLTSVAGCAADDGDTTAQFSDTSKNWTADQWKGGILRITSGDGRGRVFEIVGNSATALTVQQNEVANTKDPQGVESEYTVCDSFAPDTDTPDLTVGGIAAGDSYAIGIGEDENGFGHIWNKNFVSFQTLGEDLYCSIAHNYDEGARVWKSSDGMTWSPSSPYSFNLFHGFDPEGSATGVCLVQGLEDRNGAPVCSSVTNLGKSAVSGTETLYTGGTGSSGCNGRGARVARLDGDQWNLIVDYFVDDNDAGTNENGFGDASSFIDSNFQAWSWENYDGKLFVGVARIKGCRIMYTATGSADDGAWTYAVGGDAAIPDGFDGVTSTTGYGANIVPLLHVFDGLLYAGTIVNDTSPLFSGYLYDGADLWQARGRADALVWSRITADGFGDTSMQNLGRFCEFNEALYIAGSNQFGGLPGAVAEGSQGARIFRLKEMPRIAAIGSLAAQADKFSVTLSWITDNETDCSGFNLYRSSSEKNNNPYEKINSSLISATGAGSSYTFTDRPLRWNTPYYYKIECVSGTGKSQFVGPHAVTTKKLLQP